MLRRRRTLMMRSTALLAGGMLLAGCTADGDVDGGTDDALAAAVDAAIADADLSGGGWAVMAVDLETGETVYELDADLPFVPGSIQKSVTTSAALSILGSDTTITTPVYATGDVSADGVLDGDLVLVGRGDFSFGLRDQTDGTLEITGFDHNEANTGLMSVALGTGDPLAALEALADQIVAAGITSIEGSVLVDNSMFEPKLDWPDGRIDAIWVNENLIDAVVVPTSAGEAPDVAVIPDLSGLTVVNEATTVAGDDVDIAVEFDGSVVTVEGEIGADAGETVRNTEIDDPVAFARLAFTEVLSDAGVEVRGDADDDAVPDLSAADEVAAWESAPISELVRVVQKTSYNRGADLLACHLAVAVGETDCVAGVAEALEHAADIGVDTDQVRIYDSAGSIDYNRTSARAQVQLLTGMAASDEAEAFLDAQPIAGVDGSLATFAQGTDAEGMIRAKTGTRVVWYPTTEQYFALARAYSGYMTTASGRELAFTVIFNSTLVDDVPGLLEVSTAVGGVALALQAEA